jgi:hypothetical protein
MDEIGDFGLGVMMYFKLLMYLMVAMVICLGLSAGSISTYTGDGFSGGQVTVTSATLSMGSAICDQRILVCTIPDGCNCEVASTSHEDFTFGGGTFPMYDPTFELNTGVKGDGCKWVNLCDYDTDLKRNAMLDLALLIMLVLGLFAVGKIQDKAIEEADEAEQTAQDYSIIVNDPDADATDPDEWQKFFSQFGHVSYVTVAINNGELLKALAARRLLCRKIAFETATPSERAHEFDPNENDELFDGLTDMKKKLASVGLYNPLAQLRKSLLTLDIKIEELCKETYEARKVFVVFDLEASQRSCLKEMSVGTIPAIMNIADLPEHQKFRSDNILSVSEAPEPTDVIWENLETTLQHQIIELSTTGFATCVIIGLAGLIIVTLNETMPAVAAVFVSMCNGGLPAVFKAITNTEEHLTNTSKQSSLLLKLVLSRWLTTAIIIWSIRPFDTTLTAGFLTKVGAVLVADAFTTPIIRMMDPAGRLARHFSAKSAPTQEKMNSFFENTAWFLAERYTDMTKSLFVGLFFACLYPAGLIFSLCSFIMCYWVDKYCLFRLWKQPPAIDASLTVASRMHIAVICIFHGVISNQVYAGFPFNSVQFKTAGGSFMTLTVDGVEGTKTAADLWETTNMYEPVGTFDVSTDNDWMTDDQKDVVQTFSIVNIIILVLVLLGYFGSSAFSFVHSLFRGDYKPVGDPNPDMYSFVPGIATYVPTFVTDLLPLPLLCCDLSLIDLDHISFTADYAKQDVTMDHPIAAFVANGGDRSKIFSTCKQYKSDELKAHEAKEASNV